MRGILQRRRTAWKTEKDCTRERRPANGNASRRFSHTCARLLQVPFLRRLWRNAESNQSQLFVFHRLLASTSTGPLVYSYRVLFHSSHPIFRILFRTSLSFLPSLLVFPSRRERGSCCTVVVASRIGSIVRSKRKTFNNDTFEEKDERERIEMDETDVRQSRDGASHWFWTFEPIPARPFHLFRLVKEENNTISSSWARANRVISRCSTTRCEFFVRLRFERGRRRMRMSLMRRSHLAVLLKSRRNPRCRKKTSSGILFSKGRTNEGVDTIPRHQRRGTNEGRARRTIDVRYA